jgi:hypothetical protein
MARTVREIAEQLVAGRSRKPEQREPVIASASDFAPLDRRAYDRFRSQLTDAGYQHVADYRVDGTYGDADSRRYWPVVVRCMLSADGAVCANYYQMRPKIMDNLIALTGRALRGGLGRTSVAKLWRSFATDHDYCFESEIGTTFVGTSTTVEASAFTSPAEVSMHFFPRGTSLTSVRVAHESRVRGAIARGLAQPTRMTSLQESQAMEGRCEAAKHAHRAKIGWVTQDELYAILPENRVMAEAIYREVELINRGA